MNNERNNIMGVKFTYYGGMCIKVERSDGFKILCDPYFHKNQFTEKVPADFADVDLILVTHHATDHYGDVVEVMQNNSKAKVMMPGDCVHIFKKEAPEIPKERIIGTIYGDCRQFGITTVRTMVAWHGSRTLYENGFLSYGIPVGFMVQVEPGVTYYHPGDTALHDGFRLMRELYSPNVMAVGIGNIRDGASCEQTPREAAKSVEMLGAKIVIPTHYIPGSAKLAEFNRHMQSFAPDAMICEAIEKTFTVVPTTVSFDE